VSERIRVDEWQAALAALAAKNAEGFTTAEMAEQSGRSVVWVQTKLREAHRKGLLECNGTKESTRMDGKPCRVPVYRAVKREGV
jgi:predicted transcriptional regulator